MWSDNAEVVDCLIEHSPVDVIEQLRLSTVMFKTMIDDLYNIRKLSCRWLLLSAETFHHFINIYNHRHRRDRLKTSSRNQIIWAIAHQDVGALRSLIDSKNLPVVGGRLQDLYFLAGRTQNRDIMNVVSRLFLHDGYLHFASGRAAAGDFDFIKTFLTVKPQHKSEMVYWLAKHGHGKILNYVGFEMEGNEVLRGLVAGNHLVEFQDYYSHCLSRGIDVLVQPLIDEALKASTNQPIDCLYKLFKFTVNDEMIKHATSYEVMKWLISKAPSGFRDFHRLIERMTLGDHLEETIKIISLTDNVDAYFAKLVTMAAIHGAFKIVKAFCEYVDLKVRTEAMGYSIIKGHDHITYCLHPLVKDRESYYRYLKLNRCSTHIKQWLHEQVKLM